MRAFQVTGSGIPEETSHPGAGGLSGRRQACRRAAPASWRAPAPAGAVPPARASSGWGPPLVCVPVPQVRVRPAGPLVRPLVRVRPAGPRPVRSLAGVVSGRPVSRRDRGGRPRAGRDRGAGALCCISRGERRNDPERTRAAAVRRPALPGLSRNPDRPAGRNAGRYPAGPAIPGAPRVKNQPPNRISPSKRTCPPPCLRAGARHAQPARQARPRTLKPPAATPAVPARKENADASTPPPARTPGSRPALFASLTREENKVLSAHLTSGWYKQSAVYPALSPAWNDTSEILGDLHAAWMTAFARDQAARSTPPARRSSPPRDPQQPARRRHPPPPRPHRPASPPRPLPAPRPRPRPGCRNADPPRRPRHRRPGMAGHHAGPAPGRRRSSHLPGRHRAPRRPRPVARPAARPGPGRHRDHHRARCPAMPPGRQPRPRRLHPAAPVDHPARTARRRRGTRVRTPHDPPGPAHHPHGPHHPLPDPRTGRPLTVPAPQAGRAARPGHRAARACQRRQNPGPGHH